MIKPLQNAAWTAQRNRIIWPVLVGMLVILFHPFTVFANEHRAAEGHKVPTVVGDDATHADEVGPTRDTDRPMIWVTPGERDQILQKIEDNTWAGELYAELKSRADEALPTSLDERRSKLLDLPLVWNEGQTTPTLRTYGTGQGNRTDETLAWGYQREPQLAMMEALQDAVDFGVIYYLTGEEQYAAAAADTLSVFVDALVQLPIEPGVNDGWVYENGHLLEARILAPQLPIIYDFVHPYLAAGGEVYDLGTDDLRPFNFEAGQDVFRTYVDLALNRGNRNSNWPVLESTSLLQNLLAIDDAAERKRLLAFYIDQDTDNQLSLESIYERFQEPGDIWPESLSYSTHVTRKVIFQMTLLDRIFPDLRLGARFPNISLSLNAMYDLQFPNLDYPVSGDSSRRLPIDYLTYEMALQLAKLNGDTDQIKELSDFLSSSVALGDYDRGRLQPRRYGPSPYKTPLQLLWSTEELQGDDQAILRPPRPRTSHLNHAGLTVQRNLSEVDPQKYSLMAALGGGSFVHSHGSGMDLELYGQGHVLGIDSGRAFYTSAIHENYYRLFAAHNTVISNGASATKGGWVQLGTDRVEPVVLEPAAGDPGVSPDHSFVTASFEDKYNLVAPADHQRTVALIRLNDQHGYYLDIFRARSAFPDQFHDYVYHNAGDRLELTAGLDPMDLRPDADRYQGSAELEWVQNRAFQHPGWHYFEDVQTSGIQTDDLKATFVADNLGELPVRMNAWIPEGQNVEVTQVTAPPSSVAPPEYTKKPVPTFLLRRYGEAWSNPFVVVFESDSGKSAVRSVDRIMVDDVFKGVRIISEVDSELLIQYIIVQEEMTDTYHDDKSGLEFVGQFAVVTSTATGDVRNMYIGSGTKLSFAGKMLETSGNQTSAFIEF